MPENNKNFTEEKIIEPLMRFAMPVMFALFLQAMYGAVDLMVVGKTKQSGQIIMCFGCMYYLKRKGSLSV